MSDKIPAEQMSRWPSGFLWLCLLHVEVLFCCMRRSAVSLGCSEPGWERWREGTAPTHRLYPEWGIVTFINFSVVSTLDFHPSLFLNPRYPLKNLLCHFHGLTSTYPNDLSHCISIHVHKWRQWCCKQTATPFLTGSASQKTNKACWARLTSSCILKSTFTCIYLLSHCHVMHP